MPRALLFTPEELEELRRADAEIEAEFRMTREEREAGDERDRQSKMQNLFGRAAYQREYYEANRESIAAYHREYREANREAIAAYQREYRKANRKAISAKKREYYEANREALSAKKREILKNFRLGAGMSQQEFGRLVGVSRQSINRWETGAVPINLDILGRRLPELAEEVKRNE